MAFLPGVMWSLLVGLCPLAVSGEPTADPSKSEAISPSETEVRFDRDIRPILSDKCFFCHGPDEQNREADLRLDLEELAKEHAIVEGDVEASELIERIRTDDTDLLMPPIDSHKELSRKEIELLTRWVGQGARWTQHWSFTPPSDSDTMPPLHDTGRGMIDAWIAHGLNARGLQMNDEASREKLIRRVTFDLTGLPPTLSEIDAFLADHSDRAYEKVVDRLLSSRRYGERMALMWMDAARYGDTSVYHADGPRDMWAWRDTIVDAYNQNMPFDEFSIAQLAGDLIPGATLQQKVLAGFNRNNGTTDEGGAIAEEYRVEYAVDRVKTTSTVWLGLTMECAQCHDHKYDPISQEDYYRFYAFFNISRDGGMQTRKGNAEPTLAVPDPQRQAKLPQVEAKLASNRESMAALAVEKEPAFQAWLQSERDSPASSPLAGRLQVDAPLIAGQGESVTDLARDDTAATIHGKVDWVDSRNDFGIRFDGGNYVDLGDAANFERDQSFSYGGWVQPQKGQSGALLARMDNGNSYRGFDVLVGDGPISVHLVHKWPDNAIKVNTKKRLKPGKWQHVLVTYDGTSKAAGVKVYVDGESWPWEIEQDGLSDTIRTEKSLLIGSRHPGSRFKGVIDEAYVIDGVLTQAEVAELQGRDPIRSLLQVEPSRRTDAQRQTLKEYYLSREDQPYRKLKSETDALASEVVELKKPLTTVMVMGDLDAPRETFVLNRGAYDSPTDRKVLPGTPSVLPPMAADAPKNRLGLARWLFRDDHPLTARVAVNRYWQMLFGAGLTTTPADFGAQGEFPAHPELLDRLAGDFRRSGWDVKRMIKQMVMSQTYRQSSHVSARDLETDPVNRWLGRGPRFRLQGEFIRDNALSVSGLLVDRPGGPGVKPYQPPGLWAEVGLGGNPKFKQDHGEKLYRRSLYTYWKRSAPPPAMQIFDAPTREKCTIRRARTNTPLQALTTLNDTQFVEASRHFAQRVLLQGGPGTDDKVSFAFRLATARVPTDDERGVLKGMLEAARQTYRNDLDAANALTSVGESKRDESLGVAEHAAWTIVASAILNLDETLTRE